ncbi:hypothetical protein LTR08_003680 [Meristemomyces frigidus]|nr:hypothetical protein LTR08_003680 [Meristemomyces frigidus]
MAPPGPRLGVGRSFHRVRMQAVLVQEQQFAYAEGYGDAYSDLEGAERLAAFAQAGGRQAGPRVVQRRDDETPRVEAMTQSSRSSRKTSSSATPMVTESAYTKYPASKAEHSKHSSLRAAGPDGKSSSSKTSSRDSRSSRDTRSSRTSSDRHTRDRDTDLRMRALAQAELANQRLRGEQWERQQPAAFANQAPPNYPPQAQMRVEHQRGEWGQQHQFPMHGPPSERNPASLQSQSSRRGGMPQSSFSGPSTGGFPPRRQQQAYPRGEHIGRERFENDVRRGQGENMMGGPAGRSRSSSYAGDVRVEMEVARRSRWDGR